MRELGRRSVWSLLQVSRAVAKRFEDIPSCWVEAEVANLRAGGRQVYFTLADGEGSDACQLDASMNAIVYERLSVKPEDGALVQAYGRVEYWMGRNQVRLRVERLELSGDGLLRARIEELTRQLDREGLTDPARKRPLPFLPRRIGLVTSGDGAARVDVMTNLRARFPGADVCIVNALVQGTNAPTEIARAVRYLDAQPAIDVIIVARGGGSLEDLMAFNSETVCRAVASSATPVVSAIGHETDVTVCDLVADLRVSTPTKAAEAVVPDARELADRLDRIDRGLRRDVRSAQRRAREHLGHATTRLARGLRGAGHRAHTHVDSAGTRLGPAARRAYRRAGEQLTHQEHALRRSLADLIAARRSRLDHLAGLHRLLSPARTVARGYAILRRCDDAAVVTDAAALHAGDRVTIDLRDGRVAAEIGSPVE
jgi:exodeoxyribonuclease VII large subunit